MSIHGNQTPAVVSAVFLFALTLALPRVVFCGDNAVVESVLETEGYVTYGRALRDQVAAGDGGGVDPVFRNSGVELDLRDNAYFAVNGVHPVRRGDYSSYYPKSVVKASLEDDSILEVYSFSKVSRVASFSLESGWAPSGLYAHSDSHLYIVSMRGRGTSGNQMIFKYDLEGTLRARITIPESLGMIRPDGIAFDEEDNHVFIVDSQGPIHEGFSLYRIPWTNQGL